MEKAFVHFIAVVVFFFGTWFLLSKVNFVDILHVEELTKETEHKLGDLVLETIKKGHNNLESDTIQAVLDSIKHRLCKANDIKDSSVTLHVLINDDVNAFALPDRHLVIYTGLIRYCNSAEELSGVMAHEVSHIEHNHVMKKLMKEVGLAMLITIAGGESGGEIAREVVKQLSSTAFDREQEKEADASAVHMMAKADIDPEYFANFLFRLSQEKDNIPKHFEWLSTHPNSQDRSAEILRLRKQETYRNLAIKTGYVWKNMKAMVSEAQRSQEE
jgi:predicted Zn-dependent protease